MARFAIHVYGRFSFNYFGRNADNLLVGWRLGTQPLGFYKKAYDLFALSANQLTAPLTNVAVSALSRFRPGSTEYKQSILRALAITAFVGMGLGADLTLIGRDVIRVLLGPAWAPAARIFIFFGPGIGMMLVYQTHGWIHLSIGKPERWFRWGILEFAVTGVLLLLGLHWGPDGVAAAWTVSFWLLAIPALCYALRPIHVGLAPIVATFWKYVLASLLAGSTSALLVRSFPTFLSAPSGATALGRIVVISSVFLLFYLVSVVCLYRSYSPLREFARFLLGIVGTEASNQQQPQSHLASGASTNRCVDIS
jgi:PST family polysaccharide transporter